MRLYKTSNGPVVQRGDDFFALPACDWDELLNRDDLLGNLHSQIAGASVVARPEPPLAPIGSQEVWAAGVTYWRSRTARMEESKTSGGGSFYDRVYEADRPELFFKATPVRVKGPGQTMRLRRDSRWIVPEPEMVLVVNRRAQIIGYTVGNDLSSRDIEGENPLYLPQAKVFDACAALGPAILISNDPLPPQTEVRLEIRRGGKVVSTDGTQLDQLKRSPASLVEYLFREMSFPVGCFLFTGTGIIPADDFTLQTGDEVRITIPPIGTLINLMAQQAS